jgi:DNA-binding response OmpR family regulator
MLKKVLIVEDSEDVGAALRMLIEFEGYQAVVAHTAADGRIMARAARPDLIIMDIRLPDGDGVELTRELRGYPETLETPIVCVSAYGTDVLSEAVSAGCNEAISKGNFIDSYRPTLKKYLGG